jgi:hypothetical protein
MKTRLGVVALLLAGGLGVVPAVPAVPAQLGQPRPSAEKVGPLADNARVVLAALVKAAERNHKQPAPLTKDQLTEYYFREAAAAAQKLPTKEAADAFLLALGIGLDESDLMRRKNPFTRELWVRVEPEEDRQRRLRVLGEPTMRGRHDLAQHFTVSCALTAIMGPKMAESAGVLKEQLDMQPGGSGFSFVDLCADFAGIAFANQVRASDKPLAEVEKSFRVTDYLPRLDGLREDLTRDAFTKAYGNTADERYRTEQAAVWKRVLDLPVHRKK